MRSPEYREEKKKVIMKKCYECYCENGLRDTGIKELGKYCGMTSANLYAYLIMWMILSCSLPNTVCQRLKTSLWRLCLKIRRIFYVLSMKFRTRQQKITKKISAYVSGLHPPEVY